MDPPWRMIGAKPKPKEELWSSILEKTQVDPNPVALLNWSLETVSIAFHSLSTRLRSLVARRRCLLATSNAA